MKGDRVEIGLPMVPGEDVEVWLVDERGSFDGARGPVATIGGDEVVAGAVVEVDLSALDADFAVAYGAAGGG